MASHIKVTDTEIEKIAEDFESRIFEEINYFLASKGLKIQDIDDEYVQDTINDVYDRVVSKLGLNK